MEDLAHEFGETARPLEVGVNRWTGHHCRSAGPPRGRARGRGRGPGRRERRPGHLARHDCRERGRACRGSRPRGRRPGAGYRVERFGRARPSLEQIYRRAVERAEAEAASAAPEEAAWRGGRSPGPAHVLGSAAGRLAGRGAQGFRGPPAVGALYVLLALLGLVAIGTTYGAADAIRSVGEAASGRPSIFLTPFLIGQDPIPSFVTLIGFIVPVLGIAFGFDAVERRALRGDAPAARVPADLSATTSSTASSSPVSRSSA